MKVERPDYWRSWSRETDVGRMRARLRAKFGMSIEQFYERLKAQGGKCALCDVEVGWKESGKKKAYVDHCHETGRVRGILCPKCNTGIGLLRDCPKMLEKAIRYLKDD